MLALICFERWNDCASYGCAEVCNPMFGVLTRIENGSIVTVQNHTCRCHHGDVPKDDLDIYFRHLNFLGRY